MNKRLKKLTDELDFYETDSAANIESVKSKVFEKLNSERKIYMNKKMFKTAFIAATLIALLTATVIAAVIKWDDRMIELFNPTDKQMEELTNSVTMPMLTAENNGVKVTVKQTLADKHGIYVLYDIEAPEGFEFNEDIRWKHHFLKTVYMEENDRITMSIAGEDTVFQEKNRRTALYHASSRNMLDNSKLKMEFSNLGYWDEETFEFVPIAECEFYFEWDFEYKDTTKTINVNKPVKVNTVNQNLWTTLEISPMTLWVQIEGDDILTGIEPVIKYRNGREVNAREESLRSVDRSFSNNQTGDNKKGMCSVGYHFKNITDLSEIESITVGDITVPID